MTIEKGLNYENQGIVPFAQINNDMLQNDNQLSFKAKGILCYLLSCPIGWNINETDIIKRSKDKRDSVRAGLKELIDAGYIIRNERKRTEKGYLKSYDYIVYQFKQKEENIQIGKSKVGKSNVGKSNTINKELINKDYINKEKDIKRYIQLELDVDNRYIQTYLSHYKLHFNRDHPKVSEEQYEEILRCINIVTEELDNIKKYSRGVVDHFESLPKRNNGNIMAFIKTFMRRYDVQTKEEWT